MPNFRVDYTYDEPRFSSLEIEAASLDEAEKLAIEELVGCNIECIEEVKAVA